MMKLNSHKQAFHITQDRFTLVNMCPIAPGHVLVCPFTPRLRDLSGFGVVIGREGEDRVR